MLDTKTIELLQQVESIKTASAEIQKAIGDGNGIVALPNGMTIHDLEKFMPYRRRQTGVMQTSSIEDFCKYTDSFGGETSVFIGDDLRASAIMDFFESANPGHADNRCVLELQKTSAYLKLLEVDGRAMSQTQAAEFIEDWTSLIESRNSLGDVIENKHVAAAIRSLTIESAKKVENEENALSLSRGALESIAVKGKHESLPTSLYFSCQPYHGLLDMAFMLRMSVITGDKPAIVFRIAKLEEHKENMRKEMASIIMDKLRGNPNIYLGEYKKG